LKCVQGSSCPFDPLDLMTHPKTNMGTSWYTFSDRTCPLSCPPRFVAGQQGTLSPEEDEPFLPSPNCDGPEIPDSGRDGGWPYREVRGGRENNWGIGFGFDFNDEEGPSPVAQCPTKWCEGTLDAGASQAIPNADSGCTSTASADTEEPDSAISCDGGHYSLQPVLSNESVHAGISFWARAPEATDRTLSEDADGGQDADSGVAPPTLTVLVSDVHTADVGYKYIGAGACNPCTQGVARSCGDDFGFPVTLTSGWKRYFVRFSELCQAGWSHPDTPGPPLDTTFLGHIIFELQTSSKGNPLPPFSVQIAYVEWFDEFDDGGDSPCK
jgi:hypothetical protein